MPCRDYDDDIQYDPNVAKREAALKKRLDRATRNLCSTCRRLEKDNKLDKYLDKDTQNWWTDHKAADEKRIQQELAKQKDINDRRSALNKLSEREKKLLGLSSRRAKLDQPTDIDIQEILGAIMKLHQVIKNENKKNKQKVQKPIKPARARERS